MALKSRASATSFKSLPLILSRNLIYKNPEPIFPHRALPSVHFSPLPGELYEVFGLPPGNFTQPYHTGFLIAGVCALTWPKISEVLTWKHKCAPRSTGTYCLLFRQPQGGSGSLSFFHYSFNIWVLVRQHITWPSINYLICLKPLKKPDFLFHAGCDSNNSE